MDTTGREWFPLSLANARRPRYHPVDPGTMRPHPPQVLALFTALVLAALPGCRELDRCCAPHDFEDADAPLRPGNPAGIVLSFDDAYIDAWHDVADLLEAHGAVATFFVTRVDRLDPDQLESLRDLERRGHEIGCHGLRHRPAGAYSREHGVSLWVEDEITPAVDAFDAAGLSVASLSFPHGEHTDETGWAALDHFSHIRGSTFIGPLPELRDVDAIFLPATELSRRRFSCACAIDERYGITPSRLERAVDRAADRGEVLAIYGHEPLADAARGYETAYGLLEAVLDRAQHHDMRFYLYREFSELDAP